MFSTTVMAQIYFQQVMRHLSISRTTLLRFIREGKVEAKRDAKERYVFDEGKILVFRDKYFASRPQRLRKYKKRDDAEIAREVFLLFEAARPMREIVIELGVEPAKVRALYKEYRADYTEPVKADPNAEIELKLVQTKLELERVRLEKAKGNRKIRHRERRAAGLNVPDDEFGSGEP